MKISKLQLDYFQKSSFTSSSHDGIRHVKTLPYLSVVQAVEGNYDIQLGSGEIHNTQIGGFFIAPSNVQQTITHHADRASKQMICRWVFLRVKINDLYDLDDLYNFPVILPEQHKKEMHCLFNRLFATDNLLEEYVCYYEIIRLLHLIATKKATKTSIYLDRALAYMKENLKSKLTVQEIAQAVSLSESRFYSVFKKETGVSPITYLNNYRLSVAAELLLKTDQTVTEISDAVGISDSIYFNKIFRKAYQMPPSKYRKIYKNGRK